MDFSALLKLPPQGLVVFLLVLVRCSSIFLTAPLLGNTNTPQRLKVGLSLLLALIFTPFLAHVPLHFDYENPYTLGGAICQEVAVGVVIGFLAQLLFVAVQFAGQAVGLQMGFGMASVFDSTLHTQVSVVSQFYTLVGTLVFLLLDGHHTLIVALERSFTGIPLGTFQLDGRALAMITNASTDMFWASLMLMAPVLGVLALGEIATAIVARIMPQMNAFVAAFPLKIGLGIITISLSFPLMVGYLGMLTESTFAGILRFIAHGI